MLIQWILYMTVMCKIAGNWEPCVETGNLELKYLRASCKGSGKIWGIEPNISHHFRNHVGLESAMDGVHDVLGVKRKERCEGTTSSGGPIPV
nr:hypothetical protein CFP56_36817 [Quercus suber]